MEDSNPNKINIDDGEEEDEINTSTYCPYKKVTNFFGGLFGSGNNKNFSKSNSSDENPKLSTENTEKQKCPFGYTSSSSKKKTAPKGRCPFGFGAQDGDDTGK